jgi:hypothetical protein
MRVSTQHSRSYKDIRGRPMAARFPFLYPMLQYTTVNRGSLRLALCREPILHRLNSATYGVTHAYCSSSAEAADDTQHHRRV